MLRPCVATLLCIPETGCLQPAPILAVNSPEGVFFIQGGRDSATAVRGRKAQWPFKRQSYHCFGCHVDVVLIPSGIMSVERIKKRGKGASGRHENRLEPRSPFYRVAEKTCANIYFPR